MRKAISIRVNLWIEAEDEPSHNFAEFVKKSLQEVITQGNTSHPELKIHIRSIKEQTSEGEDTEF